MMVFGSGPARNSRRVFVALGLTAVAVLSSASALKAQNPPAAAAAAQQPAPAPDPFLFKSESVAIIYSVQAAKTADFEGVWKKVKDTAAVSEIADAKAYGASLRVYKIDAAGPGGAVLYLFVSDPMPKGMSMDPSKIIYLGFPMGGPAPAALPPTLFKREEADGLFGKLRDSLVEGAGITSWPLAKIVG